MNDRTHYNQSGTRSPDTITHDQGAMYRQWTAEWGVVNTEVNDVEILKQRKLDGETNQRASLV